MFEDLRDAETEGQYLQGLTEDLALDLDQLDTVIRSNRAKLENLGNAMKKLDALAEAPAEQQAAVVYLPSSYLFFEPSDFTYQMMRESGEFRLISSAKIKSDILRLVRLYSRIETLQANYLQALDSEYIPLMMNRFDLAEGRISDLSLVQDQMFVNFFAYSYQDTDAMVEAYLIARDMASNLLDDIRVQAGDG